MGKGNKFLYIIFQIFFKIKINVKFLFRKTNFKRQHINLFFLTPQIIKKKSKLLLF